MVSEKVSRSIIARKLRDGVGEDSPGYKNFSFGLLSFRLRSSPGTNFGILLIKRFMQTKPTALTTLTSVLERLRVKKQDNEFKMTDEGFTAGKGKHYDPADLKIIKTFRFEGESDPADSSILY